MWLPRKWQQTMHSPLPQLLWSTVPNSLMPPARLSHMMKHGCSYSISSFLIFSPNESHMNRTTLQKLELQQLKLQSQEVISGIGRLRNLKYLNLAGVESLEDAALCSICSSCSALESLYVQDCPLLTDGALQALPSSLTCLWFSSTKVSLNLLLSCSTLLPPSLPSQSLIINSTTRSPPRVSQRSAVGVPI